MVGNDIVDLAEAQITSKGTHPRFIDKVFTNLEQEIIEASSDPFRCIWQLWSMKESAYKIYMQQFQIPFFDPKKIECQTTHNQVNQVRIQERIYYTTTKLTEPYTYTIACTSEKLNVFSETFVLKTSNSSVETRMRLINALASLNHFNPKKITIQKCLKGIPSFFLDKEKLPYSISLTHHGNFGGIALFNII